jgi:mRNA interferase RelE/StbE
MTYSVLLHPKAHAFLTNCDDELAQRIRKKILILKGDPDKGKKLKYSDFWRLRIGEYRAIYEIDYKKQKIIVLYIGHRRDVCDDFSRIF